MTEKLAASSTNKAQQHCNHTDGGYRKMRYCKFDDVRKKK